MCRTLQVNSQHDCLEICDERDPTGKFDTLSAIDYRFFCVSLQAPSIVLSRLDVQSKEEEGAVQLSAALKKHGLY